MKSEGLSRSGEESELSALMRLAQAGDGPAYGQLLKRVQGLMEKFVRHSLSRSGISSGGEDVVQEILLALHAHRGNYDPEQFFLPWLYAIARYKVIDHLRGQKVLRRMTDIQAEVENLEAIAVADCDADRDLQVLGAALPVKQWEVLRMVKLQEMSLREVSEKTGYSLSDVKVTVHRALENLKKNAKEMA